MRLIDADMLLDRLEIDDYGMKIPKAVVGITKALIEDAPTIELRNLVYRPTGEWRHYEGILTCSECGSEFCDGIMEYLGNDVPRCCPNCGSYMRGDTE